MTASIPGVIKVNWDAAVNKKDGCVGFGIVARDCDGMFLGAKCIYCPITADHVVAEALAATHAVLFSKEVGFVDVLFEGDALQVVREIQSDPPHASRIGHFVESIQHEMVGFRSSCVVHAPRETNGATHALAKQAVSIRRSQVWVENIPTFILPIVLREQVLPRP
jgi:ribonuclease HI